MVGDKAHAGRSADVGLKEAYVADALDLERGLERGLNPTRQMYAFVSDLIATGGPVYPSASLSRFFAALDGMFFPTSRCALETF